MSWGNFKETGPKEHFANFFSVHSPNPYSIILAEQNNRVGLSIGE